jgi:AmmeMemoRadiSam system protein B
MYPKLRPLQPMPTTHAGRAGFVLRDPLALSAQSLFLPRELAPLLALCDGTRDLAGLQAGLMIRFGVRVSVDVLAQLVGQLDTAYLLDNERSIAAHNKALTAYRNAPSRAPRLAGSSYPADPDLPLDERSSESDTKVRGVVCPHIDFQRGGRVYAGLWRRAAEAARQAELIVLLGTDHIGGRLLTLTRQQYASPWGVLPTDREVVDALAAAIGTQEAFGDELNHQVEHSLELAIVWLHAALEGQRPHLVPILTGSFHGFVNGQGSPDGDERLAQVIAAVQEVTSQRRTLVVAAADLAHMGPAFSGRPLDLLGQAHLKRADEELLHAICAGDAEAFFDQIKAEGDRRNICGLPPIYLALRTLSQTHGQVTGYEICPADQANTSSVSVAGVLLW